MSESQETKKQHPHSKLNETSHPKKVKNKKK